MIMDNNITQNALEKKIKRHIYGKPQSILVIFPPGLVSAAQAEVASILGHLWFQNKFSSEVTVLKNALRIDQIHFSAILELMMRGQCFTDIRLIISEGKLANMPAFAKKCEAIDWDLFVSRHLSMKLKVDVGGSPALHEGAMKDILVQHLGEKVQSIVTGEDTVETTSLYVDVYKYQMVMSLSLAGAPLYKRGYRSVLSKSAPLREDIAACCLRNALRWATENQPDFVNDSLFVPFSGTGTFLVEYWMARYQFPPVLFGREYAVQRLPLYRAENFNYLMKKAREHCSIASLKREVDVCIDHSAAANESLEQNINNFQQAVTHSELDWPCGEQDKWATQADFTKENVSEVLAKCPGNIFIPMNPPYGIRLGQNNDTVLLYKKIAQQINTLAVLTKKRQTMLTGFILCPSEEAWSRFCQTLTDATIDTYHITQGGLDIRVAQFFIK